MKRIYTPFTLLLFFLITNGCTTNSQISQTENPSDVPLNTNPDFAINNPAAGNVKISGQAQKIYNRHLKTLDEKAPDNYTVYSQLVDVPEKTTYTAVGNVFGNLDTVKVKSKGFVPRRLNGLAYLHKRQVDRSRKVASTEYIFKTDGGYYYLLAYAPVRHLIHNEEDIIIAQDSLNRKSTGLMAALIKK